MPTYEYVCTTCQNQWEEIQKISESPIEVCPKCSNATAKRQISGGNFILKGGGWYADLYSSSSNKKTEGKADASGAAKADAAAGSSSSSGEGSSSTSPSSSSSSSSGASSTPATSTPSTPKT